MAESNCESTTLEDESLKIDRLKRNELIRSNIAKAPEFWRKVWLPFFEQEHKLLSEFGHDYSSLFIIIREKKGKY